MYEVRNCENILHEKFFVTKGQQLGTVVYFSEKRCQTCDAKRLVTKILVNSHSGKFLIHFRNEFFVQRPVRDRFGFF
jgi:hypothetical protein